MAATVNISESNGAGPTVTDGISNLNFGSVDAFNLVPATYKIIKGNRSFEKWIRFHVSAISGTTVNNIYVWKSSGALVTGETYVTNWTATSYTDTGAYAQPISTASTVALGALPVAQPNSSGRWKIGGSQTGAFVAPGYSDYAVIQMLTTVSSPTTAVNSKVFSFQYDEA